MTRRPRLFTPIRDRCVGPACGPAIPKKGTTMTPIDSLTPEQERLLDVYHDRYLAMGLSCEPADFAAGMRCIDRIYEVGGLKAPKMVIAYASPYQMLTAPDQGRVLRGRARKHLPHCPGLDSCLYGQHSAGWAGFYAYWREVYGLVAETEELAGGLLDLPRYIGWAAVYEECAFLTDRTSVVRTNAAGGLHAEDGPAIAYRDGFSIYAVDDVVVPDRWVTHREELDPDLAFTWPNVEQRAVAGRLIGWDKVLRKAGRTVIDRNPNRYVGTLVEAVVGGITRRFLEVSCPTGREMVLSVPPDMATAEQANNWTYSDDEVGLPAMGEGRT